MNGWVEGFRRLAAARELASLPELAAKAVRIATELATAPFLLRGCTTVGRRVRTLGAPRIRNEGAIAIGDDVLLASRWNPVELTCAPGGRIELGRGVHVNYGTVISARKSVRIGDGAQLGQYVIVSDTDTASPADARDEDAAEIEIGPGAWLAGRVTVLPGARIGAGAVITAGSVVSGEIPPRVVAGGVPARVIRRLDGEAAAAAPAVAPARAAPIAVAPALRGTLVADFTVDALARHLADPADPPVAEAHVAGFGQVAQTLLAGRTDGASDFVIAWTRPQSAVPAFARVLRHEPVADAELAAEVDAFCAVVARGAEHWRHVFVPTWTLPPDERGLGLLDARRGGAARALAAMNLRLMDRLGEVRNAWVLDAQRWAVAGGRGAQNPKAWFLGKVAFGDGVLAEAARDVKAALRGLAGAARKLVVLDLDDTLWGGIVGDVGWRELRLGGHDPAGEAYVAFQRALKDLTRRGVLLAVVSKNTEAVALEAIRSHPEMILREGDLVGWRIDWQDKARNVADLAAELNLGLQSVVFIDDNPVERGRVREALPEVLVPEWPADPLLYPSALAQLRCFDVPAITAEDAERTHQYAAERGRAATRAQVGSIDDWLRDLGIRVRAEPLGPANVARAAQLLNKTNQMNLSTRRLTEGELLAWVSAPGRHLWTLSVRDRFGDSGLTGIVSVEADGGVGRIVDYVLSCRVMGRRVENAMAHLAVETARRAGVGAVEARLVATKKNAPCAEFWSTSGFEAAAPDRFRWDASRSYPLPDCVALEIVAGGAA